MMLKHAAKQVIWDGIISFVFWTTALTPYMLLVVRADMRQYVAWLAMEGILVPPLGALYSVIARRAKLKKEPE